MDPMENANEQFELVHAMFGGTSTAEDVDRLEELRDARAGWRAIGGFVSPGTTQPQTSYVCAALRAHDARVAT